MSRINAVCPLRSWVHATPRLPFSTDTTVVTRAMNVILAVPNMVRARSLAVFSLRNHQHRGGGITERRLVRHEYGWFQWNGNNIRDSVAILNPTVLDGFTAVNRRFRSNFNFFRFGSHRKLLSVIEKMSLIGMFQHPQDFARVRYNTQEH